jgi:hypothetical protein
VWLILVRAIVLATICLFNVRAIVLAITHTHDTHTHLSYSGIDWFFFPFFCVSKAPCMCVFLCVCVCVHSFVCAHTHTQYSGNRLFFSFFNKTYLQHPNIPDDSYVHTHKHTHTHTPFLSYSGIDWFFFFDKTYLKHPKFLKNQVFREILTTVGSIPVTLNSTLTPKLKDLGLSLGLPG